MTSTKCIKAAEKNVKNILAEEQRELKAGAGEYKGPLLPGYRPELNVTS